MQWDDIDNGLLEVLSHLSQTEPIPPESKAKIWNNLSNGENAMLVAIGTDGKVIGTGILIVTWKYLRGGVRAGRISDVATHPDYEGRGIGSVIVKDLIRIAREKGCYKVTLKCSRKNRSWYERFGFKEDEVAMRLNLL
ncbi:MAG: GNAT family N-acetyltransferase [Patescibacteria group bacterium]